MRIITRMVAATGTTSSLFTTQGKRRMSNVLAVDPGSSISGYVVLTDDNVITDKGIVDNEEMLLMMNSQVADHCVVEKPGAHVMTIKATGHPYIPEHVKETLIYFGRLQAYWELLSDSGEFYAMARRDALKYVTGKGSRVGDKEMRAGLISLYGGPDAIGLKKNPGPLYGISSHMWAALGLGVAYHDTIKGAPF